MRSFFLLLLFCIIPIIAVEDTYDAATLRLGFGVNEQNGRFYCTNFLHDGNKARYTESNPLDLGTQQRLAICANALLGAVPLRIVVRINETDTKIAKISTFEGFTEEVELLVTPPACGGRKNICGHLVDTVLFECRTDDTVRVLVNVVLLNSGQSFPFHALLHCKAREFGDSEDITHLLIATMPLIYLTYLLLRFTGLEFKMFHGMTDVNGEKLSRTGRVFVSLKSKIMAGGVSNFLFFILGVLIIVITLIVMDSIGRNVMMDHSNFMHINFGFLFAIMSGFGCFIQSKFFVKKTVDFASSFMFICVGLMFVVHEQYTAQAYFIHVTFGCAAIATGLFKAISDAFPKFTLLFLIIAHYAGVLFISAAPYFSVTASYYGIGGANYVFLVGNITVCWILFVFVVCWALSKRFPHLFNKLPSKEYSPIDEIELMHDMKKSNGLADEPKIE